MKLNPRSLAMALALAALITSAACNRKPSADVMARVNDKDIAAADVEKRFLNQAAGAQAVPSGEQATNLRLSILKELIDSELLMAQAEKLKLVASDDEVNRKLAELKSPYDTPEKFQKRLDEMKLTLEDLKHDIRLSLTQEKVFNKEITSRINVTDQEITNFYNAHRSEFNLIETQYHLAQIAVSAQPGPQARNFSNGKAQTEADARKKLGNIINELDKGADFATLATNYSEDQQSAANGGDLGFVPESAFKNDSISREALSRIQPGQHTQIIPIGDPRNPAGFRVVKLLSREPAGQRELSDPRVQQVIREQMRTSREQLLKQAYLEVIHNKAKIENYYAQKVVERGGGI